LSATNAGVLRNHRPQTALEAKISAEFGMAVVILAGNVGLAHLNDYFVASPAVQSLMAKFEMVLDPSEDPMTGYALADGIVVESGGRRIQSPPLTTVVGSRQNPFTETQLQTKFRDCIAHAARSAGEVERLMRFYPRLNTLETLADVRDVTHPPLPS
jgi:2-methylcitrate dehydratase PrpD